MISCPKPEWALEPRKDTDDSASALAAFITIPFVSERI